MRMITPVCQPFGPLAEHHRPLATNELAKNSLIQSLVCDLSFGQLRLKDLVFLNIAEISLKITYFHVTT